MNKTTVSILAAAFSLVSAQAGETPSLGKAPAKGPVPQINVPAVCDCFNAGSSSVSVYASGLLPDSGAGELDDAFGGGLAYDYFFTPNIGVMVDATWSGTDSVTHLFTGSLVLRAPITSICLAPYVFAGGGYHTNGTSQDVWHVGGGLDYRITNCWGLFADARYTWASDTQDYTIVRAGVRFGF